MSKRFKIGDVFINHYQEGCLCLVVGYSKMKAGKYSWSKLYKTIKFNKKLNYTSSGFSYQDRDGKEVVGHIDFKKYIFDNLNKISDSVFPEYKDAIIKPITPKIYLETEELENE